MMPGASTTQRRVREICQLVKDCGGTVIDVSFGKHVKIKLVNAAGEHHMLVVAVSPSDHRARLNAGARLARMLRVG